MLKSSHWNGHLWDVCGCGCRAGAQLAPSIPAHRALTHLHSHGQLRLVQAVTSLWVQGGSLSLGKGRSSREQNPADLPDPGVLGVIAGSPPCAVLPTLTPPALVSVLLSPFLFEASIPRCHPALPPHTQWKTGLGLKKTSGEILWDSHTKPISVFLFIQQVPNPGSRMETKGEGSQPTLCGYLGCVCVCVCCLYTYASHCHFPGKLFIF